MKRIASPLSVVIALTWCILLWSVRVAAQYVSQTVSQYLDMTYDPRALSEIYNDAIKAAYDVQPAFNRAQDNQWWVDPYRRRISSVYVAEVKFATIRYSYWRRNLRGASVGDNSTGSDHNEFAAITHEGIETKWFNKTVGVRRR